MCWYQPVIFLKEEVSASPTWPPRVKLSSHRRDSWAWTLGEGECVPPSRRIGRNNLAFHSPSLCLHGAVPFPRWLAYFSLLILSCFSLYTFLCGDSALSVCPPPTFIFICFVSFRKSVVCVCVCVFVNVCLQYFSRAIVLD